jgi:hypothetical protein
MDIADAGISAFAFEASELVATLPILNPFNSVGEKTAGQLGLRMMKAGFRSSHLPLGQS